MTAPPSDGPDDSEAMTRAVQPETLLPYPQDQMPMVSCGGYGPSFPATQINDRSRWDPVTEPWAIEWVSALKDVKEYVLADPDGGVGAWRQITVDGRTLLVADLADGSLMFYASRPNGDTDAYGVCTPKLVLPEGLYVVPFGIDPNRDDPAGADLLVHVLLKEQKCGASLTDRLRFIDLESTPEFLRVSLIAEDPPPLPPDSSCILLEPPPQPYQLTLPEPLAGRELLSGYAVGSS